MDGIPISDLANLIDRAKTSYPRVNGLIALALSEDSLQKISSALTRACTEDAEPLRFADKRLLERAIGSLSKGDVEDATKCIEVVLERSPDFN